MFRIIAFLAIFATSAALADAPVIWSGSTAKWLPSGLKTAGVLQNSATGVMTSSPLTYSSFAATTGSRNVVTNSYGFLEASPVTSTEASYLSGTTGSIQAQLDSKMGLFTLPLAVTNGGTGTATAFTSGSVVFAGPSGVYAQDNANLFFDDTENELGLGTADPAAQLHLSGNKSASAWTTNGIGFRIADQTFTDTTSTGSPSLNIHNIGSPTIAATNAITPNNLTTLFIGAPVDGTNVVTASNRKYALRTTGNTRFAGFNLYGTATGNPVSVFGVDGNQSDTSWTTVGKMVSIQNATLTDTSGTGTISTRVASSYGTMTLAASNPETITNAANLYIDRAPTAGSNVTITNSSALYIPGGSVSGTTNSYALNITAGTGATNNYAATFDGRVGMGGVTDPSAFLTVATNGSVVAANEQIVLRSNREAIVAGELLGGVMVRSNDSSNPAPGIITNAFSAIATATHNTSTLDSAWVWYTTSALTMSERMRLDKDGNLGIGVTPVVKLHQDSGTATATTQKFTAGSTTGQTASDGFDMGIDASGNAELRQREALPLTLYTNNAAAVTVLSGGNTGIGTTAPGSTLHIAGSVQYNVSNLSANTTLGTTHSIVTVDDSAADKVITVPACTATLFGRQYRIKKLGAAPRVTYIAATGSDLVDGATSQSIAVKNASRDVVCTSLALWSIY